MTRKRFLSLACILIAGCSLSSGCLKRKPPVKRSFVLEVTRTADLDLAPQGLTLHIQRVRVSPLYEGKGLVYRLEDGTFESDFYNEFFALPAYLLTEEIMAWFSGRDLKYETVSSGGILRASHTLKGRVHELYGDYSGSTPQAVLGVEFILLELGEGNPEAVFRNHYRQAIDLPDRSPDALIEGFSQGLQLTLQSLQKDLKPVLN